MVQHQKKANSRTGDESRDPLCGNITTDNDRVAISDGTVGSVWGK